MCLIGSCLLSLLDLKFFRRHLRPGLNRSECNLQADLFILERKEFRKAKKRRGVKKSGVSHLVNDVAVEEHHAEVVNDHGDFEVVGFAVGHVARPHVQNQDHVAH